ncbi:unnamed protein product, partial [marine sediment metagenome]
LSQQMGSKFATKVRNETVDSAELAYFDTLAEDDDTAQKTGRHQGTPISEAEFGRRRVVPYPWTNKKVLDKEDLDRMLPDPRSPVAMNQVRSLGRKKDDLLIAAALGAASIGKAGGSSVDFEDESISINGDGTLTTLGTLAAHSAADISLAKMLTMMRIFNDQDVDPDIPKYWAVTPKDIEDMLHLTEIGSADYNTVKTLVQGKVDSFAGFNFFWCNRLTTDALTGNSNRSIAWAQDGLILASIGDISTRIEEAERLDFAWVLFSKMDLGAVRMEGAKVHE